MRVVSVVRGGVGRIRIARRFGSVGDSVSVRTDRRPLSHRRSQQITAEPRASIPRGGGGTT
jgi:hypothetical protein